uniref:Putative aminotransferase n=1 Tax=viral metagenome TaxID=1070528 RepID=A0A6M3KUP2_9ZZZZ
MKQDKSLELYKRALEVIPGGTQTLSKYGSRLDFEGAPKYLLHGNGCIIWDVDRNKYIDWSAALGPNILGYDYFENVLYGDYPPPSLPLPIEDEVELAELLCKIIPCAEMVRFFKTGSDATTAAVRLARAVTGRGNILCCGYHGWHDWYVGTLPYPKKRGTLDYFNETYGVTKKIEYGDIEKLKEAFMNLRPACFILEPMNRLCPEEASREYLLKVKELCKEWGVVLIFDEIIMGFRHALAGGQELYGVTPDLATYSKAMANGHSISALVGSKLIMKELEEMQVSGTYFGETNGIRASLQTINYIIKRGVIDHLWKIGNKLTNGIDLLIEKYNLFDIVEQKGFGPWSTLVFKEERQKQIFLKEVINQGIYFTGEHFVTYSHKNEHIERTLEVYDFAFNILIM